MENTNKHQEVENFAARVKALPTEAKFEQPLKMFIVSLLCKRGRYDLFMRTGINEDRRGRFTTTPDRSQARPFAKLTAESLAELLSSPKYGLRARVEPQQENA